MYVIPNEITIIVSAQSVLRTYYLNPTDLSTFNFTSIMQNAE